MPADREDAARLFMVTPFFESRRPTFDVPVGQAMARQVVTARPSDNVYDAAHTMLVSNIAALPVVENDRVVGVVSLSDLLYRLKTPHGTIADAIVEWLGGSRPELRKHLATEVREIMTCPAITIEASDTVSAAAARMLDKRVHQLPVLEGGKLVGVISRRDVIATLAAWAEEGAGVKSEVGSEIISP